MTYRDDDDARAARAGALIDEIAALEREKLARADLDHRLATARNELATLQAGPPPAPPPAPSLLVHLGVFAAAAAATFAGYTLLVG
ncbi:MAG TPA: hypothetical protein VM734_19480 [Kofleriaceae bacterium]|nr:hypothetical protein [Kofleriaceae bacterium]